MVVLKNRAKVSVSTTGTGSPITLGAAEDGYQTFAASGVADGNSVRYILEEDDAFEIGVGVVGSNGTSLTRSVIESSNSNNPINLGGAATVFIGFTAEDADNLFDLNIALG
ncbi:hypothetical protein UM181_14970 [Alphaproteobacteria bacterium US3C007]|nr:hypothetical protein UM181_14970 [Alphaproteobacteria bacterium US3C007]